MMKRFLRVGDLIINLEHIETVNLDGWAKDGKKGRDAPEENCVQIRLGRSLARFESDGRPQNWTSSTYNFFAEAAEAIRVWWRENEEVVNLAQWWREKKRGAGEGGVAVDTTAKHFESVPLRGYAADGSPLPPPPPKLKPLG